MKKDLAWMTEEDERDNLENPSESLTSAPRQHHKLKPLEPNFSLTTYKLLSHSRRTSLLCGLAGLLAGGEGWELAGSGGG